MFLRASNLSHQVMAEVVEKVKAWENEAEALISKPFIDVYQDLVNDAGELEIDVTDETKKMQEKIDSLKRWKDEVASNFLKPNSSITLMEALSPRAIIDVEEKENIPENEFVIIHGVKLSGITAPHVVDAAFKKAEEIELDQIQKIRIANCRKRADNQAPYCICKMKGVRGVMLECALCKDKYHCSCLNIGDDRPTRMTRVERAELDEKKFICPPCHRTKRPTFDNLVKLEKSLKKIQLRIPEGEALRRLTERAMDWQGRAREMLNSPELLPVLRVLNVPLPECIVPRPVKPAKRAKSKPEEVLSVTEHHHAHHTTGKVVSKDLDATGFKQLKQLMIEGELMGIDFQESSLIWRLLQIFKHYFWNVWDDAFEAAEQTHNDRSAVLAEMRWRTRMPSWNKLTQKASQTTKTTEQKPTQRRRTTKPAQQTTETAQQKPTQRRRTTKPAQQTTETVQQKPTRPKRTTETTQQKPNRPSRSTEQSQQKPKQTKRKPETITSTGRQPKRVKESEGAKNDENSLEECANIPCSRPKGEKVMWVQCDGCELWYHMKCVRMKKNDLEDDEPYFCHVCRSKK
ncbi:lysine-specific demethylase lid-like [Nilaparvata lugens]|uniref:lysine-specific demethylase lid-like n=1 Tax=Nilaparvata lugens TaxID=108931 RepID=UPI00193E66D2|nr:lysine-specific demethylase lid-like [Nilaparvata lugens]